MLLLPGKAGGDTLPGTQLGLFVCQSVWLTPQEGRHPVALLFLFCFSQLKKGKEKKINAEERERGGERGERERGGWREASGVYSADGCQEKGTSPRE